MSANINVLLIDPSEGLFQEGNYGKPLAPNLGLAYIASSLKKECHATVKITEMRPYDISMSKLGTIIDGFSPDIVGITAKTFNILSAYKVADLVKRIRPEAITVIGGAHGTVFPELTLQQCNSIDAVVRREGESTMSEMVNRLVPGNSNQDIFSKLNGVSYRSETGVISHNEDRELIRDLDSLPFPDYSMYNLKSYGMLYNPARHKFSRQFSIITSRGCPYKCTFCAPILTRKFRQRSVANVMEEIDFLIRQYNCDRIYFEDSTFCVNRKWFDEFCNEFIRRKFHQKITWGFESRVELLQDVEIFRQAKDAGCTYVYYGIESGNQTILDYAQKGITKEQIVNAVDFAKKAGINQVAGSFIFGLPYESKESVKETLDLIRELELDTMNLNLLDVYPGTKLWDMVDRGEGGIRWLPEMRLNWGSYSRGTCQTVVDDLSEQDLQQILANVRKELVRGFWKKGKKEFIFQFKAYLWYYLRNNPKQLWRYLRAYIIPRS